jgi:hypothetical protein
MPTVVVIDNEREEVMRLGNLIEAAFPDWTVLPDRKGREGEPLRDWNAVVGYLLGVMDSDVVLCLDLSIGHFDWEDVERGVRRAHSFRNDRPTWTFIAYTKNSLYASGMPEFKATFDGLLEKSELARKSSHVSAVDLVRLEIETARRRHRAPGTETIPKNVRIVDSLGMRSFRAAFSDETLGDIIRAEAAAWGPLEVESLTSGYSGAYMLSLTSVPAEHSVILKLARNEEAISHELRAQTDHLTELAPFGARFALIQPELHRLRDGSGVYYRQMPVQGVTLLKHCLTHPLDDNLIALGRVTRLCIRVLKAVPVVDRPSTLARNHFVLSPVDIGRLETSAQFLAELGSALAVAKLWPTMFPAPRLLSGEVTEMVRNWSSDELTDVMLPEAVQHGDFNPGNVMLDAEGEPVLIDNQRLRRWPLGYDMARLAGLLRIRLTDVRDRSDWLPFHFASWCEKSLEEVKESSVVDPICPEAAFCENEFFSYVAELPPQAAAIVAYSYRLGSLWDLIKIISYQDVSPMKRAYALARCWLLAKRVRDDRAKLDTLLRGEPSM